jgi:hypothetical protein
MPFVGDPPSQGSAAVSFIEDGYNLLEISLGWNVD